MRIAVAGNLDFCSDILRARLEEKPAGYVVTHCVADGLAAPGEPPIRGLPVADFRALRLLVAEGKVDALVIAIDRTDRRLVQRLAGLCKLSRIRVGVIRDPRRRDVLWLGQGKGFLYQLETHVIDRCNLNCALCTHFSALFPRDAAPLPLEPFRADLAAVAERFDVLNLYLLGGEPLLVPGLADYMAAARDAMPRAFITLFTNGLLIPGLPDETLDAMARHGIILSVTVYPPTVPLLERIRERLNAHGVTWKGLRITEFVARLTAHGIHDPESAHAGCSDRVCRILRDGRIYKCPSDAYSYIYNERFGAGTFPPPTGVDIRDRNAAALVAMLDGPIDLCRHCIPQRARAWSLARPDSPGDWLADL